MVYDCELQLNSLISLVTVRNLFTVLNTETKKYVYSPCYNYTILMTVKKCIISKQFYYKTMSQLHV